MPTKRTLQFLQNLNTLSTRENTLCPLPEVESVKLKVPKYTLTEAFAYAGSPQSTPDVIAYDNQ